MPLDPKLVAKQPGNANGSDKRAPNDSLLSVSKEHRKGHPRKTENLKTALVQPYPHLTPTQQKRPGGELRLPPSLGYNQASQHLCPSNILGSRKQKEPSKLNSEETIQWEAGDNHWYHKMITPNIYNYYIIWSFLWSHQNIMGFTRYSLCSLDT